MYNEDDKLCFFHRRVTAVGQGKRQEAVVDGLAEKI